MELYKNLSGNSGVKAYENGPDSITVEFNDGDVYVYTYQSAGREIIEEMKTLALAGKGLNGYISKFASKGYALKLS